MKRFLPLLLLLFSSVLLAQGPDLDIPAEVRPIGEYVRIKPKTEAKSITYIGMSGVDALPSDFLGDPRWFLLPTRGLPEGQYKFEAVGSLNDVHTRFPFIVVIGSSPNPPVVIPGPNPPVVVPNAGKRAITYIYESLNKDVNQGILITNLQSGKIAADLAAKGHTFFALDVNLKDKDGNPSPRVKEWEPIFKETTIPAVVITDKPTDGTRPKLILKSPLLKDSTPERVLDLLKNSGGL